MVERRHSASGSNQIPDGAYRVAVGSPERAGTGWDRVWRRSRVRVQRKVIRGRVNGRKRETCLNDERAVLAQQALRGSRRGPRTKVHRWNKAQHSLLGCWLRQNAEQRLERHGQCGLAFECADLVVAPALATPVRLPRPMVPRVARHRIAMRRDVAAVVAMAMTGLRSVTRAVPARVACAEQ